MVGGQHTASGKRAAPPTALDVTRFRFVLWYIGGALVAVSGALLIMSMGVIDPALADDSDRLGSLMFALTCGAFLVAVVVAGIQWWSLRAEDARMQLADHQMLTAGSGGPAGQ